MDTTKPPVTTDPLMADPKAALAAEDKDNAKADAAKDKAEADPVPDSGLPEFTAWNSVGGTDGWADWEPREFAVGHRFVPTKGNPREVIFICTKAGKSVSQPEEWPQDTGRKVSC